MVRNDGDLHLNLAASEVVLLKRPAAELRNRPIVDDAYEGVQQQPREAPTVLPSGTQPTVLFEGAMGIVVHLRTTET
jgi:hypothetical protein